MIQPSLIVKKWKKCPFYEEITLVEMTQGRGLPFW
jgi:hypothetical protein